MVDYELIAATNRGLAYTEDGGDLTYESGLDPSNLGTETTLGSSEHVLVGKSNVPHRITLQNLTSQINVGHFDTGLSGQGVIAAALIHSDIPRKNATATISSNWTFTADIIRSKASGNNYTKSTQTESGTGLVHRWEIFKHNEIGVEASVARIEGLMSSDTDAEECGRIDLRINAQGDDYTAFTGLTITGFDQIGSAAIEAKIGINKEEPESELHIAGDPTDDTYIILEGGGSTETAINLKDADIDYTFGLSGVTPGLLVLSRADKDLETEQIFTVTSDKIFNAKTGLKTEGTLIATPLSKTVSNATVISGTEIKHAIFEFGAASDVTMSATAYLPDGVLGQILTIINVSSYTITLNHGASYNTNFGADIVLQPNTSVILYFTTTDGYWHKFTDASGASNIIVNGNLYFGAVANGNYITFSGGKFRFYKSGVLDTSI